ncbi:MAG: hypothetical protein K5643_09785 [Saccharofermentans sp.]|nr:hypothetical protein [Saccharofermentans sp.]
MKKYMKEYMAKVDSFISEGINDASDDDVKIFLEEFDRKLSWFCHERLIHLLVTLFFALFLLIGMFMLVTNPEIFTAVLAVLFLCLTGPYVFHYYFLENSVQELYKKRDRIEEIVKNRKS